MSDPTLKKSVEQHFRQYELPDAQLEALLNLQQNQQQKKSPVRFLRWALPSMALCASILFAWILITPSIAPSHLLESIADEVAKNHIKLKPLEVKATELAIVGAFFDRLNFTPIKSNVFGLSSSQLLGGRYCSIKGEIASQLRYVNDLGQPATLYQAILPAELSQHIPNTDKNMEPIQISARGLGIRVWLEKGLVMASVNEGE